MNNDVCLLLFIFTLFFSCGKNGQQEMESGGKIIDVPEELDKMCHLDSVFSSVTLLHLETKDEYLISDVSDLVVVDSLIYINDNRKRLLVFGTDGTFRYEIGAHGEGPGEFLEVRDFIINKDQIELLDYKKIITYTLDGEHLNTKQFDLVNERNDCNADNFCHSPLGGYYFWDDSYGKKSKPGSEKFKMYHVDDEINIQQCYFESFRGTGTVYNRFSIMNKDTIIINPFFADYNIYQVTPDGKVSSRYFFNFGKNAYTQEIPTNRGKGRPDAFDHLSDYVLECNTFFETDKWIHVSFAYQNKMMNLFFNKNTQKSYLLSGANPKLQTDEIRYWGASALVNDQLVMPIDASWLKIEMERMSPAYIKKLDLEQYKELDEFSNPFLVFYKLR